MGPDYEEEEETDVPKLCCDGIDRVSISLRCVCVCVCV